MVEPELPGLSIVRQCELLALSRSGRYYQPTGESAENLSLMRLMDQAYLKCPYYGARQMRWHLQRLGHKMLGHKAGRHRVARLMRKMGLAAIHQKPNTSRPNPENRIYPLSFEGLGDHEAPSGVVHRHNLYLHNLCLNAKGLFVSGGGDGLAQSQGAVMAGVKHHACGFLGCGFLH